ncbi:FEKKY domain-containing protein [Paenimyroides aestuarii]|uniref:Uncharacterized protein n=1 Tax=Paenimyroides aestuarii TaxID=2968490 RepID=A0ABY5NUD5_9FLAO|nr:hypothetical protein [Paenimyroides aestuarii]UUV22128.1 hypothetical protein NPX36_03530 [Paenimyroides aestuarii]
MKLIVILIFFVSLNIYSQDYKVTQKSHSVSTIKGDTIKTPVSFILFGIADHSNSESALSFKNKFAVGFRFESCVVLPTDLKRAEENNREIAKQLTQKFGVAWLKELPFSIPGVENS